MLRKLIEIIEKFTVSKKEESTDILEKILSNLTDHGTFLTQNQNKILTFLYHSNKKFKAVEAPTGSGKTLSYLIYILSKAYSFDKIIISTYTKGLQFQIFTEIQKFFPECQINTLLLFGKSNYLCPDKVDYFASKYPDFAFKTDNKISKQVKVSTHYCNQQYRNHCKFKDQCEYFQTFFNLIKDKKILITNHFLLPYILRNHHDARILLVIDECHTLFSKKEIYFSEDDLLPVEEPDPKNFTDLREYNLALEQFKVKTQKQKLAKKLNITQPGKYTIEQKDIIDFSIPEEVLMFSGTLPDSFGIPDEEVDILYLTDSRSWQNVTIEVKDINYLHPDYYKVLVETIKEARKKYSKVIVLCTSYQQLKFLKSKFGSDILTNLDEKPFIIAEKMKAGEANLIAGTDVFWTGIDIPGEKCIIMTKLPFPVPEGNEKNEESFITGFQQMFRKFKQGIGRMLRTPQCGGEIIILDNRVSKYQDLVAYLEELKQKQAKVIYESKAPEKVVRLDFKKAVNY